MSTDARHLPAKHSPAREVEAALRRGATLLTPNLRSARYWSRRFDTLRQAEGAVTWTAASVLPWRAWTAALWNGALVRGTEDRVLLNDVQEMALWTQVLTENAAPTLRPLRAQAKLCSSALRLLAQYDTGHRFQSGQFGSLSPDATLFAEWFHRFEEICSRDRLLPAAYLETELAVALRTGGIAPAAEYLLWSVTDLTPAEQAVVAAVEGTGAVVTRLTDNRDRAMEPSLLRCGSERDEMQQCAAWVRQQVQAAPDAVVVVVPDLDSVRPQLERELRAVVAPEAADLTRGAATESYEFSSGRPLLRLPLVTDAVRLLRWCCGSLSIDDAGAVLRSPFLRMASSPERGAELDRQVLRKITALRANVTLAEAAGALETREPAISALLRRLASGARAMERSARTVADLADGARRLLETAGWPGATERNSEAYQAVERWNETLDRLATLDLLGSRMGFAEFVRELRQLAGETLFAPENTGAPVQVVTDLEAVGSPADALWFLRADETTWPPRPALHPLLPPSLQHALAMPGTPAARDDEASARVLQSILRSAGEATFSYAAGSDDRSGQPSALVRSVAVHTAAATQIPEPAAIPLEVFQETKPLPTLPSGTFAGGVSVLTEQGQCGFRAFAQKRLFSVDAEAVDAGLSPQQRGEQVHAVLQAFWTEVKTQQRMKAMARAVVSDGSSERDTLLRRLIREAIPASESHAWDEAYLGVQRERLFSLLTRWLTSEESRAPFEVLTTELEVKDAAIGPLHLTLRIDRVDRVITPDGDRTLIIDYKTGAATSSDWLGPRPDQPQLPVYAVAEGTGDAFLRVDGLAFGLVRVQKDGMCLNGLAEAGMLKSKPVDIDEHIATWRQDLTELATAFARGDAVLNPKEYPKTCNGCGQRILCRLDPAREFDLDPESDEEDEVFPWA